MSEPARGQTRLSKASDPGASPSIEVVEDEAGWDALEPVWDALLVRTPGHTVFQSYAWLRLWWQAFGAGKALYILVLRRNSEVVGIAPLQISQARIWGRSFRRVELIGMPDEIDRPTCLFPETATACAMSVLDHLHARRAHWDMLQLDEQIAGSPLAVAVRDFSAGNGLMFATTPFHPCPYLELDTTWEAHLAQRSRRLRRNLRAAKRRLSAAGRLELRRCTTPAEIREHLPRYVALEARSWKPAAGIGIARSPDYLAFYEALARSYGGDGAFHLLLLELDGRPIAGTLALDWRGVYYSLQIAHDGSYDACSPGTVLEALELETCFASGAWHEYDFLGGALNNKLRWTSTVRPTLCVHAFRKTPRLVLLFVLYFRLKPLVRRLLERAGWLERVLGWRERLAGARREAPAGDRARDGIDLSLPAAGRPHDG